MVVLIYPDVTLLDATGPVQVFNSANENGDNPGQYEIVLASADGGPVVSDCGVALHTVDLAAATARPIDTLLIAGGRGIFALVEDPAMVAWLRAQAPLCRRVASTCMGSFLTAAAGLLDGRRATSHWRWCRQLQEAYPDVQVEHDPIFVRDGAIWSSAGVSAGIDMALAMVEEDAGHALAYAVACALVVFLKRPGGQAQCSATLSAQLRDHQGTFGALNAWITEHLAEDLRVECLAARSGMSPRSFARCYSAQTGTTPAKAVECLRVEAAKRLLEQATLPLTTVARRSGFRDLERMRRAFLRQIGTPPSDYRARFGREDVALSGGD